MTITELQDNILTPYFNNVSDIYFGDAVYHFNTSEVDYDSVVFSLQTTEVSEYDITYKYIVTYADLMNFQTDNEFNIFDNGLHKLEKAFNQLSLRSDLTLVYNHIYTPFKQKFSDTLAGWQVSVEIKVDNPIECE